jgi:hypothetical protein
MNAVPSRLVIPDSYRSNFRPFYLQPPHAFLSFCSLCSPEDRSRIFRSPFSGRIPFLASSLKSRLANASGRIEFIIVLFVDWSFASGCSPPRLSTTQLPSATDRPVLLSDEDFHPIVGAYFQAHFSRPFGPTSVLSRLQRSPSLGWFLGLAAQAIILSTLRASPLLCSETESKIRQAPRLKSVLRFANGIPDSLRPR